VRVFMKSDKEMVKRNYCGLLQGMPVYMVA